MKVTLCIAIALVAVASAAPFEWPKTRRDGNANCAQANGGFTPPGWCPDGTDAANTCQCASASDCNAVTEYCNAIGEAVKNRCPIDGTTVINTANAACICGAKGITKPTSAATAGKIAFSAPATDAAPQFCLLNSDGTTANKRISADTCPTKDFNTASTNQWNNAKVTCGNNQDLNACAAGHVCKINAQQGGTCLPVCTAAAGITSASAAGTAATGSGCACGSNHVTVAANEYCGIKTDGTGVALTKAACSTANSAGTVDVGTNQADRCNCGTEAVEETTANNKYCSVVGVVGKAYANKPCTAAEGAGATNQNGANGNGAICNCGTTGNANPTSTNNPYCVLAATGGTGNVYAIKLCTAAQSTGTVDVGTNQADRCQCGAQDNTARATSANNKYCSVVSGSGTVYANPVCTAAQGAGTTNQNGANGNGAICNCGSTGNANPTGTNFPYCVLSADGTTGNKYLNKLCSTANSAGTVDVGTAAGDRCQCGNDGTARATDQNNKYCFVRGTTMQTYATAQCGGTTATAAQGTGAAKVAANCQCGTTAIADAAVTCKYCFAAANYVGVNGALADCPTTDGSAANAKGPNSCKCATATLSEACDPGDVCYTGASFTTAGARYCRTAAQGVLASCKNAAGNAAAVNGAIAAGDDCLCGTEKINKNQYCIASINAANTAPLGNCFGVNGRISVAAGVACKCGPTTGTRSDDICTVGQFCDGSQAGTGNSGANGKCLTTALAAPAADTTYGVSTITQAVTFSTITAAQWTGALKTAGEIGYAQAQGWTTGAGAAVAIAPGFTVTSTAARRAATVTFTSTLQASPAAVTAAKSAVTATNLNSNMVSVDAAKSLGATIPAAGTIVVAAAASTTAPAPTPAATVSGASTVTTSIMAMAVAVLAAFQARQ